MTSALAPGRVSEHLAALGELARTQGGEATPERLARYRADVVEVDDAVTWVGDRVSREEQDRPGTPALTRMVRGLVSELELSASSDGVLSSRPERIIGQPPKSWSFGSFAEVVVVTIRPAFVNLAERQAC